VRAAIDTNVLVYAEGMNGRVKQAAAVELLKRLPSGVVVVSIQVLGELFHVLARKSGKSSKDARAAVLHWQDAFPAIPTSQGAMISAIDLAVDHRLTIWDALILSVAAEADCRLLLTEDLHEGFTWRGVTVVNPFAPKPHPLISAMFDDGAQ
jgi:predicted nucleic acid-binding protein